MSKNEDEKLLTVDDVRALREEISLMHGSLAQNVLEHVPLIKKVSERFIRLGLDRTWTETLLAPLAGSTFDDDEEILVAYVLEELDTLLEVEAEKNDLSKKVHIVVGATGVGKSSLIGKLAARYSYLLEKRHKVAFINFDTKKVGAQEQLENYSNAMNIPLVKLDVLLEDEYDTLFIDTAGSFDENQNELEEFIHFIESKTAYDIEVSLVISASAKVRDLEKLTASFASLKLDNFVVTKLDETCDLSDLMNFLVRQKKPMTYFSKGQNIPEDLMVASKEYLLQQFMQEF